MTHIKKSVLPALLLASTLATAAIPVKLPKKKSPEELREEYLARLQQDTQPYPDPRTPGSLWSPAGALTDPSADYKAHNLHDNIVVLVSVQTAAAQSGNVNSARAFATNSAITGLPGGISTHGVNPLLSANSNTTLKGQGQTASNTTFSTSLTGQVIAVLPNGNLVVEAQRQVFLNNQHENIIVRGIARPGDVGPNNVVASTALSSLEIEMKGKGIISDSVRPPNPLTKAVLWLFGF